MAFATDADGVQRVLRVPRRPDVSAKIVDEANILDLVKRDLTVRVPNWEIQREEFHGNLRKVGQEFTIAQRLRTDWETRLADDGLWPKDSTFTHGDLYPAHLLLSEDVTIRSVLDWTTARSGDPAVGFAIHQALSTAEVFQTKLDAFVEASGRVPARLIACCIAHLAATPFNCALYAMTTGER